MWNGRSTLTALLSLGLALASVGCEPEAAAERSLAPRASSSASIENRTFTQRERLGNPLVSEVMIRKAHHHAHNTGTPSTDAAEFTDDLTGFVTGVAGRDPAYASAIAGALLPDMLITYPKRDGTPVFWLSWVFNGYGGRTLRDDVVDIGLQAIFGSILGNTNNVTPGLTTDNVNANDKPFLATFPYVAGPS